MSNRRSSAPLVLGLLLILVGALFLAANVYHFDIAWLQWLKFVVPALLVLWGVIKLVRHFSWDETRISHHPGRAGILGGLLWLCIGTIWILDIVDVLHGFDFFGLYWPLLLVVFGAVKVVDYYRFSGRLQFRPAEIIGVLILMLFGVLSGFIAEAHFPLLEFPILLGEDDLPLGEIMGKRYEWSSVEVISAIDVKQLEVSNLYGDVRVRPADRNEVEVKLTKEVFASDEEKARETADLVRVSTSADGPLLKVGTNREDLKMERSRFKSHLYLSVPKNLNVKIVNGYGNVRVSEIDGELQVENSFGDIVAEDIGGSTNVNNRHDRIVIRKVRAGLKAQNFRGSVQVEEISGSAELKTEYDSITALKVQGDLTATNRFGRVQAEDINGSVRVEGPGSQISISNVQKDVVAQHSHKTLTVNDVEGAAQIASSYSQIRISNVAGTVGLNADHATIEAKELRAGVTIEAKTSQINLSKLTGTFYIASSLRDITVTEFTGSGEVLNEFGDVLLVPSAPLQADLSVASKNGNITLKLPKDAAFELVAQAPGGRIRSEFDKKAEVERSPEATPLLETVVGSGGPRIRLQTTHAEIRLLRQ